MLRWKVTCREPPRACADIRKALPVYWEQDRIPASTTVKKIVSNVSPLGYILGDEGSGAVLGKRLVGDCLKKQLPPDLCELLLKEYELTPALILDKVYRQPLANRFLASLTPSYPHTGKERRFMRCCFPASPISSKEM